MSNQYARLMREGVKLPPEAKDEHGRLEQFEPTKDQRELVETMAANGVAEEVIAKLLKVSRMTVRRRFKQELADGRALVTARMGASLVREGIAGNVAAIKYWLLTRGGPEWKLTVADVRGLDPFSNEDRETVHFYMPPNHRDEPEQMEGPPEIEGEALIADADADAA
jgi:hypothetical protein